MVLDAYLCDSEIHLRTTLFETYERAMLPPFQNHTIFPPPQGITVPDDVIAEFSEFKLKRTPYKYMTYKIEGGSVVCAERIEKVRRQDKGRATSTSTT